MRRTSQIPGCMRGRDTWLFATPAIVAILATAASGSAGAGTVPDLASTAPGVIYLNDCASGCVVNAGADDSVANTSSLVGSSRSLPAFSRGAPAFAQLLACVSEDFSRYAIEVVTEDPSPALHIEAMVAGAPSQAGYPNGVEAVAPFSCAIYPSPIVLVFETEVSDPDRLCQLTSQQVAFTLGLEPVFHCPDIMSYLSGCGSLRSFTDTALACGTFAAAPCQCGGTTLNPHQSLAAALGLGAAIFDDGFESPP